ncbi:MAG: inorganic triphosphatase, partial [Haemophilus parainfluenzae]|nr:inorganic triphosphatase [Haemophilus parainfluenzae]
ETKDNFQTIEKLKALLKSRAYFERMLGLMMLMA